MVKRAMLFALLFAAIGLGDIPLARLDYNFSISTQVTPHKEAALQKAQGALCGFEADAGPDPACTEVCTAARDLSKLRQHIMWRVRILHPAGGLAALAFDELRAEKAVGRVDRLLKERPCVRVLESVDKTNSLVNAAAFGFFFLAGGAVVLLLRLIRGEPAPKVKKS
jgi:hypothetical protein